MSPYIRRTPADAETALVRLGEELELYRARTEQLAREFAGAVCACIEAGATWGEVGRQLGMSKQAARAHWAPYLAELQAGPAPAGGEQSGLTNRLDVHDGGTPGMSDKSLSESNPRSAESSIAHRLDPDFLKLWTSQSVSVLGSSLSVIALPWVAYSLTHSPFSTALVAAAQIAPYPVLGIASGVIADRFDRRRIMILSDVACTALAAALASLIALSVLRMWMLVVITVALGTFSAIFDAAYSSIIPQIVSADLLNAANGRLESSSAGASVIGPQIGGALISAVGTVGAFGLDALSYFIGAIGSSLLRFRVQQHDNGQRWRDVGKMARTGVAYLAKSRVLRLLTTAASTLSVATGALDGLLIPLLRGKLHYGGLAVGAVFSMGALGWLVSSLLAAKTKPGDTLPPASLIAIITAIAGGLTVGLTSSVYVIAGALFFFQGGVFYFLITVVTLRQRIVPTEILGRVHALARALGNLGTPLGAVAAGALAATLPVGPVISVMCSAPLAISLCPAWRAPRAM